MSESVTLLIAKLYAKATEPVRPHLFIDFYPDLISILGDINSEVRL
jgi:hypothetical protein